MLRLPLKSGRARRRGLRPGLEGLEDRVTPTTFRVNTVLDTVAVNLKTGKDASGHISLRSAIMAADAHGGTNKIVVPAGTFTLTLVGTGADDGTAGELDINANVAIQGRGAGQTIIDGNNTDRVIEVLGGTVSITGVTIQHGRVTGDGGGILNNGGRLSLSSAVVANNVAVGSPGSFGGGNGGNGGAGQGGGIFNEAGSLTVTRTTIASNQAIGGNGGNGGVIIFIKPAITSDQSGGAAVGDDGFAAGQGGSGEGGGIFNAGGATVTLNGATIASNQAIGGDGGVGTIGFDGNGGAGGASSAGGQGTGGNGGAGGAGARPRGAGCSISATCPSRGSPAPYRAIVPPAAPAGVARRAATATAATAAAAPAAIAAAPAGKASAGTAARAAPAAPARAAGSSMAAARR